MHFKAIPLKKPDRCKIQLQIAGSCLFNICSIE